MATVSVVDMRRYLCTLYGGIAWQNKVAKMSDNQVIAIYRRIVMAPKTETKKPETKIQMSLF